MAKLTWEFPGFDLFLLSDCLHVDKLIGKGFHFLLKDLILIQEFLILTSVLLQLNLEGFVIAK